MKTSFAWRSVCWREESSVLSRDEKVERISFLSFVMPSKEEMLETGTMEEKWMRG